MLTTHEKRELFKLGIAAQYYSNDPLDFETDDIYEVIGTGAAAPKYLEALAFMKRNKTAMINAASDDAWIEFMERQTDTYLTE